MGLRIWLPLINDVGNQGLDDVVVTNSGATSNTSGKIGTCYSFNGSSNYLSMPYNFYNSEYSVCAWVYTTSSTATQTIVCDRTSVGSGFSTFLIDGKLRVDCGGNNLQWKTSYSYPTNTWFHVAITYDGAVVRYYINGEFKESKTQAIASTYWGNVTSVGASQANGSGYGNYLNGMLNDVRVYDHALSLREVKEISKGLLLHYPLSMSGMNNFLYDTNTLASWRYGSGATLSNGIYSVHTSGSDWSGHIATPNDSNSLLPYSTLRGKTITVSVYAKSDVENGRLDICIGTQNSSGTRLRYRDVWFDEIPTYWKKIYLTVVLDDSYFIQNTSQAIGDYIGVWFYTYYINETIQLRLPKLEIGDHATPWVPNSADTEYSMLGFDDNIIYDTSGYQHNATHNNTGITWSSDTARHTTAIGVDSSSQIGFPNVFSNGQYFETLSISIWFKTDTYNDTSPNLWSLGENLFIRTRIKQSNNVMWTYYRVSNKSNSSMFQDEVTITGVSNIIDNNWHHWVIVFDKGNMYYYFDGELKTNVNRTTTGTFMQCSEVNNWIGGFRATTEKYAGYLSDFRIYGAALSSNDVLDLYHAPIALTENGALMTQGEFEEV